MTFVTIFLDNAPNLEFVGLLYLLKKHHAKSDQHSVPHVLVSAKQVTNIIVLESKEKNIILFLNFILAAVLGEEPKRAKARRYSSHVAASRDY